MICLILLSVAALALAILDREIPEGNEMATLEILTALVKGGMSPVGACAMGGNMMAESNMQANIAQRGMTSLTDEQYTAAADAGTIDFVHDGVGYGLCQWTYKTRKVNLLAFAKIVCTGVGSETTQVRFCLKELKEEYSDLWNYLRNTNNLQEATARICTEYERPAVNNIETRYKYAQQMYNDYGPILEEIAVKGSTTMHPDPVGEPGHCGLEGECKGRIMGTVLYGDHTPEAAYLMAKLKEFGYDVLWEGLNNCVRDFQQKRGLTVDGIVGEKTWGELLK